MKILLSLLLTVLPIQLMAQTAAAPAAAPTKAEFVAAGEKLLAKLEEFSTALDTAKDGPTAEAAKPKLAKINKEIEALSRSAAAMGEPAPAIKKSWTTIQNARPGRCHHEQAGAVDATHRSRSCHSAHPAANNERLPTRFRRWIGSGTTCWRSSTKPAANSIHSP